MGITAWPAVVERYELPAKFNLAIDATGFCFNVPPSHLVNIPWIRYLFSHAYEVFLAFDGEAPKQKISERFKRKQSRPVFGEYFMSFNKNDVVFSFSQLVKRPLLLENENTYGEGESKILLCTAWEKEDLPILCIVNDNDFYQFLIHVPPYTGKLIKNSGSQFNFLGKNLSNSLLPESSRQMVGPTKKITLHTSGLFLKYYKVDKFGVVDFWKKYSLTQRKHLVFWTTVCWGNDYLVGIAPSIKWDILVANIPDYDICTYSEFVKSIINVFSFLKKYWPKKITHFPQDGKLPSQFKDTEYLNSLIQQYLEQVVWSLVYILMNPNNPGRFEIVFPDEVILKWDTFSHEITRVSPIINFISHCMEVERYYRLSYISTPSDTV